MVRKVGNISTLAPQKKLSSKSYVDSDEVKSALAVLRSLSHPPDFTPQTLDPGDISTIARVCQKLNREWGKIRRLEYSLYLKKVYEECLKKSEGMPKYMIGHYKKQANKYIAPESEKDLVLELLHKCRSEPFGVYFQIVYNWMQKIVLNIRLGPTGQRAAQIRSEWEAVKRQEAAERAAVTQRRMTKQ